MGFDGKALPPTPPQQKLREAAENQTLALKLLNAGNSIEQIAFTMGRDQIYIRKCIQNALFRLPAEGVEEWRAVELHRLEDLHQRVYKKMVARVKNDNGTEDAEKLDLRSVDRLLVIAQRRAKLLGLDMPVKVEVNPSVPTRIIEIGSWPVDSSGQALAAPDQGVDEQEADRGDGGWNGQRKDLVRTDLVTQEAH